MPVLDPRVDAYIERSAEFARPVLHHLRSLVHKACPEVTETIKWGFPHFEYKGLLCSMAAFRAHCSFGFWKAALMTDAEQFLNKIGNTGMGHFDRITNLQDLPADKVMISYIKEAVRLNEEDIRMPKNRSQQARAVQIPEAFSEQLKENKKALAVFEKFPPSHQREYADWIRDAKTESTRDKRIRQAIEWLEEGKSRNWKYEGTKK